MELFQDAISMSMGHNLSNRTINAAVYELGRRYGTVTFVAAGNEAHNNDVSLDNHGALRQNPYAIVVAAHNQSGNLSDFSNYGVETVTLSSPGTNMLSTLPVSTAGYFPGLIRDGAYQDIFCEQFDNGYDNNRVEIVQYNKDKTCEACTLTGENGPRWSGSHAVALRLDRSLIVPDEHEEGVYITSFRITVSLTREEVEKILATRSGSLPAQLGFICSGENAKLSTDGVAVHLEGEERKVTLRLERKDVSQTSAWSVIGSGPSNNPSGNFTSVFPDNYVPEAEKLVIEFTVNTSDQVDTFFFDTVAIGVCSVPYGRTERLLHPGRYSRNYTAHSFLQPGNPGLAGAFHIRHHQPHGRDPLRG